MDRTIVKERVWNAEVYFLKKYELELCTNICGIYEDCEICPIQKAFKELYSYQAIGLTPFEITEKLARLEKREELLNAYSTVGLGMKPQDMTYALEMYKEWKEKIADGRMVELPCKVGDTVYKLCPANPNIKIGQLWDGKIVKNNCDRCGYGSCGCVGIGVGKSPLITELKNRSEQWIWAYRKDFGKTVFLTLESAEAALKERQDGI